MHTSTALFRVQLFVIGILLCMATRAFGQAGELDKSFANGGIFGTTTDKSTATAVAVQSDGKIVLAGTGLANQAFSDTLIRLNTDGSLDSSFGSGGIVNLQPSGETTFGFFGLAIQPDGKIVAAAAAGAGSGLTMQVARVNTNGSLDTSFGNGGFTSAITIPVGISGNLALQSNGEILVAAGLGNPSLMARFTSSGQLDSNFGSGGVVSLIYPGPTQIAVQSSGKILVASGEPARLVSQATPATQAGAISRYNSDGSVDTTFGSGGTVASVASASSLLLQRDGKIVAAGSLTGKLGAPPNANDVGFGIVRYSADGAVDSSFGTGGVAMVDFGSKAPDSGAFAVAIQSNGEIVAAGAAAGAVENDEVVSSFGLARFTKSGQLDTSFGNDGTVITTIASGQYTWVSCLAIQRDGKILAVGTSEFDFVFDNGYVARYLAK